MEATHLFAMIPLLVFFIMSLVFNKLGLLHLMALGYCMILGWVAVLNNWEVLFFPVLIIVGMISIILFSVNMARGNWL